VHAAWDNTVLGWIEIDGRRLIAEVNSEARADAIRKKIETALGEDVRYRASEIQSLEKTLADLRAAGGVNGGAACEEHNQLAEHPEVRAKLSAMMAAHWEHWVDQPIPILGNRTPMQAVRNRDGREIVESIVIQAERHDRSPHLKTDEDVFRRLRERLGLPGSRSDTGATRHGVKHDGSHLETTADSDHLGSPRHVMAGLVPGHPRLSLPQRAGSKTWMPATPARSRASSTRCARA
jgi:hypothetical protein